MIRKPTNIPRHPAIRLQGSKPECPNCHGWNTHLAKFTAAGLCPPCGQWICLTCGHRW